jgi:hypothetical protein
MVVVATVPTQVAFLATPLFLLALLVFSGVDLIRVSFSAKARGARWFRKMSSPPAPPASMCPCWSPTPAFPG